MAARRRATACGTTTRCSSRARSCRWLKAGRRKSNGALPQVQRGVTAPWPPRLREDFSLSRSDAAEALAQRNVLLGEGIGPAQRTHGDVMGRPRADAGELDELPHGDAGMRAGMQVELAGGDGAGECDDA